MEHRGRSNTLNEISIHSIGGADHFANPPSSAGAGSAAEPPRPSPGSSPRPELEHRSSTVSSGSLLAGDANGDTTSPTFEFTELMGTLSSGRDEDPFDVVAKGNELAKLLHRAPSLQHEVVLKTFLHKIMFMFWHRVSEVRAVGFRLVRLVISDAEALHQLVQSKMLILIIASLSTFGASLVEKEQAVRLVRQFLAIANGGDYLSIGVVKALLSVVEYTDDEVADAGPGAVAAPRSVPDSLRALCLECVCEASLLKPELVFLSGGFRVLLRTVLDHPEPTVAMNCLMVLMTILDSAHPRRYLRNGLDLDGLFATFHEAADTDSTKRAGATTAQWQRASTVIGALLKSFNGLVALSINDYAMLKGWIDTLRKRNSRVHQYVMDVLLDVMGVRPLPWIAVPSGPVVQGTRDEMQPVRHYRGLLLLVLSHTRLFEHLGTIVGGDHSDNAAEATVVLTRLYAMAHELLPAQWSAQLRLPSNVTFEIDAATAAEFNSAVLAREIGRDAPSALETRVRKQATALRYHVDDTDFRQWITNTRVVTTKEYGDWNWSAIAKLMDGPLLNPIRFDEVLEKWPKFFKRLMSFYRPFKFRFCNVVRSAKDAKKYCLVGCNLFETLLSVERGRKYLAKNKVLPQMAEVVCQMDPLSGIGAKDPVLSQKRMETTVSYGYLSFIGVMSRHSFGLRLLHSWQVFSMLHHIVEHSTHSETLNYFLLVLMRSVDFSVEHSQFRVVLARVIATSNAKLVASVVEDVVAPMLKHTAPPFLIASLVELVYHRDKSVAARAPPLLMAYLDRGGDPLVVVQHFPSIAHLRATATGEALLLETIKTPQGFKYLETRGFVDTQFRQWQGQDFSYLYRMERVIQQEFYPSMVAPAPPKAPAVALFPALVATEEGLHYCQRHQAFFAQLVGPIVSYHHQVVTEDPALAQMLDEQFNPATTALLATVKRNLWIVGHVMLGRYGVALFDSLGTPIVPVIHQLFYASPIWQIRGLCFYVLGMVGATDEGEEILDELGWWVAHDEYGHSKRLAYPSTVSMFAVEVTNPYRDLSYYSMFNGGPYTDFYLYEDAEDTDTDADNHRVLTLVAALDSVLGKIERKAQKELVRTKEFHPDLFASATLFLEVVKTVDKGSYSLAKRHFVMSLFLGDYKIIESLLRDR
ncbi:hypothetical protein DICA1_E29690 [Diutina catenulata]